MGHYVYGFSFLKQIVDMDTRNVPGEEGGDLMALFFLLFEKQGRIIHKSGKLVSLTYSGKSRKISFCELKNKQKIVNLCFFMFLLFYLHIISIFYE